MNELTVTAISSVAGIIITGWFAIRSLKATLKNNLDLAMLQAKTDRDAVEKNLAEKQKETHDLVNSRMTELLELTRKQSKAEGKQEEKDEQENK